MKANSYLAFEALVLACALCLLLAGCASPQGLDPADCQAQVDALRALRPQDVPEHYQDAADPARRKGDFDPNAYFTVLDRLSMEPGYTLDYVYRSDFLGGAPVLYARPTDQAPYATYTEYDQAHPEAEPLDYTAHLRVEDSAEGYLQYTVLALTGEQFYLNWHALYNDLAVVCSQDGLEATLDAVDAELQDMVDEGLPEDVRREARQQAVAPAVTLREGEAEARVVFFTKWGGLIEYTLTIQREPPHTILDSEQRDLVPYDCGIMF